MAVWFKLWPAYHRSGENWRTRNRHSVLVLCAGLLGVSAGLPAEAQNTDTQNAPQTAQGFGPGVDWSLDSRIKLGLDGDINRRLRPGNKRTDLRLSLDGEVTLGAETRRGETSLNLGLGKVFFLAADQPDDDDQSLNPRVALETKYRGKSYAISGNAKFEFQPTSVAQADDTGIINDNTTQLNISYGADLALQVDQLNQVTLATEADMVTFTDSVAGLVETQTYEVNATWQRQLTQTTVFSLSGGGRLFSADNAQQTKSQTFDLTFGLMHQRTLRHAFGASLGLSAVRTNELSTAGVRDVDFTIGATGGASFEYSLKSLKIGADFTQSVDPSAAGELQSFSRLASNLNYNLSAREQFGLSAKYFRRTPLSGNGSTLQSFDIGPRYALDVTPNTFLELEYLFRMDNDSLTGNATGHRVSLTLTRDMNLLP